MRDLRTGGKRDINRGGRDEKVGGKPGKAAKLTAGYQTDTANEGGEDELIVADGLFLSTNANNAERKRDAKNVERYGGVALWGKKWKGVSGGVKTRPIPDKKHRRTFGGRETKKMCTHTQPEVNKPGRC